MVFNELIAAFAAKYGIAGLEGADGAAELDVDGLRVELLDDPQTHSVLACTEIGFPPPDADDAFGSLMLKANFLLRGTEGATLCQNPETGAYALVRPFPLALTDAELLGAGLESLVNQAENWRKVLTGLHTAEKTQSEASGAGEAHHDLVSSGFVHV
jgi:hypothetical protein